MKGAFSALALAASVAPALAIPGWNRGDNKIADIIHEMEEAHRAEGPWRPGNDGGYWGNGRRPPPPHKPWGPPPAYNKPSASSGVVVSPVAPSASLPTGYSNATSSAPIWSNSTSSAVGGVTTIVTVTDYTSYYTTVYPWTSTSTSNGGAQTTSGLSTSTATSTYHSTITITKTLGVAPVGYGGSEPSSTPASDVPAGGNGGAGDVPASNVIDSTSAYLTYITVPISEVGAPSTMNPVAYGSYTPSEVSNDPYPTGQSNGGNGPETTTVVTDYVTTVTTVVPCKETHTSAGVTTTSEGTTTSTLTSTIHTTLTLTQSATQTTTLSAITITPTDGSKPTPPVYGGSGDNSSPAGPATTGPVGYTSVTTITSTQTTTKPVTTTITSGGSTVTSTYQTTSTLTTTIRSTITLSLTSTVTATASGSSSSVSGPVSQSTSSSASRPDGYGSASRSSTSSASAVTLSASTSSSTRSSISDTSYTTFTTTCSENGTSTVHTHSQVVTGSATLPPYGGTNSSTVSGPVTASTSTSSSESSFTTFTTTCTENGTTTLHTHSQPISYNATTSSTVVGPTGGSTSTSSSVTGPVTTSSSTSQTSYTTFTTTCTENGTTTLHTHSQPISYNATTSSTVAGPTGGSTTSSSTASGPVTYSGNSTSPAGPTGTGSVSSSSSSSSQSSYSTYTTTCVENGTSTVHTHSIPITVNATTSSSTVGPINTGSSGIISYPANTTTSNGPTAPITTSSSTSTSTSETSFSTYTTTCVENGTSTIHTHSIPITGNATTSSSTVGPINTGSSSGIISYPANNTISGGPTAPITTSSSSTSSSLSSSTTSALNTTSSTSTSSTSSVCTSKPKPTGQCIPCEGQPGSDPNTHCGYTIKDNPYEVLPQTCETKYYDFEITNTTISPDGIPRLALVVNGQFPGPKIEANWGDTIVVRVKNSMQNNASTIHWHGIRQNYTNEMDGVASITQCPIAPGDEMTYTFRADNYGFSWYHAHIAIQAYMGVMGPMVIHGPKSVEGKFEEEVLVVNDWSHVPVDMMYEAAQTVGPTPEHGPRVLDTGLINGMNVWGQDGAANATGKRWSTTVQPGQTKLFRILNSAIQSTFIFSMDGHDMQVIAADFVPIVPYTTKAVAINPGQRYDVLITFNQTPGDYWFRADNQQECTQTIAWNNIKAIVHYSNGPMGIPNSVAQPYTPGCYDEPMANLKPAFALDAGVTKANPLVETVTIAGNAANLYKWSMNGVTFQSEWGHPTLESIVHNGTVPTYSGPLAIEVPNLGEWVYLIIQSPIPLPHPVHLHGHDFYVLAQGTGTYSNSVALNMRNPPRRDTAMMPGQRGQGGYLVMAFLTDNPGAWLLHCHIGWHNAMGFALQIIEAKDQINSTVTDQCMLDGVCKKYNEYATANNIVTNDSGV